MKVRVAWRFPVSVGVKVKVTVQFEEPARVAPQVLLAMAKSPALAPDTPMLLIEIGELPILLKVTGMGVPVEPRATLPHTRLRGSTRTPATRQPVRVTARRRTVASNKPPTRLPARFWAVPGWIALRVIVTSSGFILLGVKRM